MEPISLSEPAGIEGPVFVLGERGPALQLVRALAATPRLCAMPPNRLLPDLVSAVDRCSADLDDLPGLARRGRRPPATWYREVQAARLAASGKARTVEFSALSILRLCELFPGAQFVVVRRLSRPLHSSRRLPEFGRGRTLEVDSGEATTPATLDRVLGFLGEPEGVVLDLSDDQVGVRALGQPE